MKLRFFSRFDIVSMSKSSLVCKEVETGDVVYIHRNAFNQLDEAADFRVVERPFRGLTTKWVEVLVWKAL